MSDVSSPAFHPSEYLGSFSDGFMRGIVLPQVRNAVQGEINRMKDG